MIVFLFTTPKYRSIHDPLESIVQTWRNKLNERMTFKGYLKKDGYLIRVSTNKAGTYQVEYSNDGFVRDKQVKVYNSRYAFLKAMESRFAPEELRTFLV